MTRDPRQPSVDAEYRELCRLAAQRGVAVELALRRGGMLELRLVCDDGLLGREPFYGIEGLGRASLAIRKVRRDRTR
jgi:hypothetical protein